MSFLFHFLRKYPFSMVCIAMIWILSLVPFFPETPLDNVEFADKWVHILMYGCTFIVVWIEYTCKHKQADYEKLFFWAWLAPIVMSGVLEPAVNKAAIKYGFTPNSVWEKEKKEVQQ